MSELLYRCELCGVLITELPEDPVGDVLCPECAGHLADVGIEPREATS